MREYKTLRKLAAGEVVDLGGIKFKATGQPVKPGDFYIGERNTGPHLLEAKSIENGAVYPTTNHYPYDLDECIAVEEVA